MKAARLSELVLTCGKFDTTEFTVETYDADAEAWMPVTKALFDLDNKIIRLYTDSDESLFDLVKKLPRDEQRELYDLLSNDFHNPSGEDEV